MVQRRQKTNSILGQVLSADVSYFWKDMDRQISKLSVQKLSKAEL